MATVLALLAAGVVGLWGVAHVIPTRNVLAGFAPITVDNRRVVLQEWLVEAATMWGIAALVIVCTVVGGAASRSPPGSTGLPPRCLPARLSCCSSRAWCSPPLVCLHSGQADRREVRPTPCAHWSGHVGLDGTQADVDAGGVDTSLNPERASGYVLLVAAVTGAALGAKAPQRWG